MLEVYLNYLRDTGIQATVWVAGSFVTEKLNPDDIDAVIIYDESSVNRTAGQQREKVDFLLNTDLVYAKFGIHIDGVISHNESQIRYYRKLFGTLRDEVSPKGIAVLRINHD